VVENFKLKHFTSGDESVFISRDAVPDTDSFRLLDLKDNRFETLAFNVWSKMFRKDFLDKNNILHDEDLLRSEDVLFTCSALVSAERITFIDDVHITYRYEIPDSNTKTNDSFPAATILAWRKLREFLLSKKIYENYKSDFQKAMLGSVLFIFNQLSTEHGRKTLAAEFIDFVAETGFEVDDETFVFFYLAASNPFFK
jgi:hypothetical protein